MKPLAPERTALLRAADYIDEHGWCQHQAQDGESACLLEALDRVGPRQFPSAYNSLWEHLGGSPSEWNDRPWRTKKQVLATLRAAALHGL